MASSSGSASTTGQIRISGSTGSGWLYRNGEPSSRDAWNPATSATAAGAAESHSYCPPAWMYASASPRSTAAAFAPAEPSGSSVTLISSPSRSRKAGGLVRLTTTRSRAPGPAAPLAGGAAGGAVVASTWPWAGSATAPAVSAPRSQSATWTAQSVRPGSPNSLVPSSGSTIHTRSAASRARSSRPSSDSTASPGRRAASPATRNSCESRSPALRRPAGSPPSARRSSSSLPACSASSAARRSSSDVIRRGSLTMATRGGNAWLDYRSLIGARALEHCRPGLPEDLQVEGQRPVLHVTQVKPDRLVPGKIRPSADLPQPGDPRLDDEPAPHVAAVAGGFRGYRRPGADERHVPLEHVP